MQTQHKINRAGQELKVLQELPRKNRIRRQLPFIDFIAKRDKLALKEEVMGEEILDAVSLFILYGSDLGEQTLAVS